MSAFHISPPTRTLAPSLGTYRRPSNKQTNKQTNLTNVLLAPIRFHTSLTHRIRIPTQNQHLLLSSANHDAQGMVDSGEAQPPEPTKPTSPPVHRSTPNNSEHVLCGRLRRDPCNFPGIPLTHRV